ncbi:histone H2B 1.2-like [Pleurodeles waltl]|uniref:histone H2B 1.2-like n=1 Tax=Pleurodeles waltl TaxID=8319 RepID=UPI003709939A
MPESAKSALTPKKGSTKTVLKLPKKVGKKHKRSKKYSYAIYVYNMMNSLISSEAMNVINSFVNDIFERITVQSSRLVHYNQWQTITSREIHTTVHLLLI